MIKRAFSKSLLPEGVCSLVLMVGPTYGASLTYINYADYGSDFAQPSRLNVGGISQDGSTVFGTIRLASTGGDSDRAYFWRSGTGLQTVEGFGVASYGLGVSADGNTMVLNANDPEAPIKTAQGRVIHVTGLGNSNARTVITPNGYDAITLGGISPDGKTVIATQLNYHRGDFGVHRQQVTWTSAGGLTPVPGLPANNPPSILAAASSDASVIVGSQPIGTSSFGSAFRWSSTGGGTYEALYQGINNTGDACDGGGPVSADGNIIAVSNGLWYENTTHAANFQNYRQLPGYNSLDGNNAPFPVDSSDLYVKALAADGSWAAGGAGSADAWTGWIWNAATNRTVEITQFLADHGIAASAFQTGDPLLDITGLSLQGSQLTIVGDTYFQNGWVATVDVSNVPEPGSLAALALCGLGLVRVRKTTLPSHKNRYRVPN